MCKYFFCQGYGLQGVKKREHAEIIRDAVALTGCSERAIQETLYGYSYEEMLKDLRADVPEYPAKVPNRQRAKKLEALLKDLDSQAFYHYDGNKNEDTKDADGAEDEDVKGSEDTEGPEDAEDREAAVIEVNVVEA